MRFFSPTHHASTPAHERTYARFEIAYTAVDVAAAVLFVVGSVLFFQPSTTTAGTWLFLVGSVCFALKPVLRLLRELRYLRLDEYAKIAGPDGPA